MTWLDARDLSTHRLVAILPVGAIEAHGPHLPLETDVIIAEAMAKAGADRIEAAGRAAAILPPLVWTAAPFAAKFPGTISISPDTATALVVDIARSVAAAGFRALAIANAHLDPAHLASLHTAAERARAESAASGSPFSIIFPDLTRKPWALRLGDEFRTGACHAGRFESSIVMAARPDLVREDTRRTLPANPASLSAAIREGKRTFAEAGGPDAYFGWPADASVEEGRGTIEVLGTILAEATFAELDPARAIP
jgi:creatinine amidohydrolase